METGTVRIGDVEFAYLTTRGSGPLALCLHGFPDTAHTWRHLAPRLAAAGYRAVAPFTRGYAPTTVPPDGLYQTGALAADANALHDALGGDGDAVIIGHDWGASAAYGAAVHAPDRWARVVGLAVPPGVALANAVLTNLDQVQRSWYMFVFLHPLADLVVPAADFAFIERLWAQWSPGYEGADDIAHVRRALSGPDNLQAALGYYRATVGNGRRDPSLEEIHAAAGQIPKQPTLYLHGRDDGCVGVEVAQWAAEHATGDEQLTIEIVDGGGHFLHLECPDDVNGRIIEHLA